MISVNKDYYIVSVMKMALLKRGCDKRLMLIDRDPKPNWNG